MGDGKTITPVPPNLAEVFVEVVQDSTAGDPMRSAVCWTQLTRPEIADHLTAAGYPVSRNLVGQLLAQHDDVKRNAPKTQTLGQPRARHAQVATIAELKGRYRDAPNPILSRDTQKKEYLGNFYREGKLSPQALIETFDPDFNSAARGVVIPQGWWDLKRNAGYRYLGTRHHTSEVAGDHLERRWWPHGQPQYPEARSILLWCDGGGAQPCHPLPVQSRLAEARRPPRTR